MTNESQTSDPIAMFTEARARRQFATTLLAYYTSADDEDAPWTLKGAAVGAES